MAVAAATARPPVNSGQRWRTTVDHRRTIGQPPLDHWSTTAGPPIKHRSTVVDRQSTEGSMGQRLLRGSRVAPRGS
ncbi:hypothetical protein Tco_0280707 [Tanacetum coccineum]